MIKSRKLGCSGHVACIGRKKNVLHNFDMKILRKNATWKT
jgi:hypothetical protein